MYQDPGLLDFATEKQADYLKTYWQAGSFRKAAEVLGVHHRTVEKAIKAVETKAARQGYAPQLGLRHRFPETYFNNKTTIQQNAKTGEIERTWTR